MSDRSLLIHVSTGLLLVGGAAATVGACGDDTGSSFGNGGPSGADCQEAGQDCSVLCDTALGCVECLTDTDCSAAQPFCVQGECAACSDAADCESGEACWPEDHECRPACSTNADCPGDAPLCDTATGACVGCMDRTNCDSEEDPLCHPSTQQCVDCVSSDDCGAATPYCDDEGSCDACLVDGHCPAGELCIDGNCGGGPTGCSSDADCDDEDPACDTSSGECVECVDNDHCPTSSPVCEGNECSECVIDMDCTMTGQVCDEGECKQP